MIKNSSINNNVKTKTICGLMLSTFAYISHADNCSNIDRYVKNVMTQNNITGVAIAIVTPDNTQFCNYGYTNKDKKVPISEKSIFEIASVTKTFTALLTAIAVTNKKLDLNAPVTQYIPELAANKSYSNITTKELLAHVAGLPLSFSAPSYTESDFLNALIAMKFDKKPGTYYEYSSPSISVAGLEVSRVYNSSYENLLTQEIFTKLGMTDTSPDVKASSLNQLVIGYDSKHQHAPYIDSGINLPTGGLKSNTSDLAKYLRLQLDPQQYKEFQEPLKLVHTNYYCLYPNGTYQQLAWEYHPEYQLTEKFKPDPRNANLIPPHTLPSNCGSTPVGFIDKTGNAPGMSTYIGYLPEIKAGVVVLMNSAQKPEAVDIGRFTLHTIKQNGIVQFYY